MIPDGGRLAATLGASPDRRGSTYSRLSGGALSRVARQWRHLEISPGIRPQRPYRAVFGSISAREGSRASGEFCGSVRVLPTMAVPRESSVMRVYLEGGAFADNLN
jgi:hypothetical protein